MMAITTQLCALSQYKPDPKWDVAKEAAYQYVVNLKQVMPECSQVPADGRLHQIFMQVAETYKESLCIYILCRGLK